MNPHKLAEYFPMLEGDDFDMLVEDIKKNGQLEPIVTYDGQILDGLNRYRACEILDIEPRVKAYNGDDPLAYVVSINVRRRHMDIGQRAILATEMLPEFEERAKERLSEKARAQRGEDGLFGEAPVGAPRDDLVTDKTGKAKASYQAAKEFGVSPKSVERAKRIVEQAPEKKADILAGRTSISAVDAEIARERADARYEERIEKATVQKVKETPKAVKDYLAILKGFREGLAFATRVKETGAFSPEAKRNITARHDEIIQMINQFEEVEG